VRGLLVLVGRPDGRLFAFTKTEAAVLLATKQLSFVENLGQNPEVVSVGSNPHFEVRLLPRAISFICIASDVFIFARPLFLCPNYLVSRATCTHTSSFRRRSTFSFKSFRFLYYPCCCDISLNFINPLRY